MRSSEPRGGNSTKSSVGQLPLLEFSWVDDSLFEGSAHRPRGEDITSRQSGKIAVAEREGCNSLLGLNEGCTRGLVGTTPFPRSGHRIELLM